MLDVPKIRDDFPILNRTANNHRLIYFDNAATTQKPQAVIDAIADFYANHNGNVHRAVHTLSIEATDLHEGAREATAKFINAKQPAEIIFTRGTTEAINLAAYSWGLPNLKEGDEVLLSLLEHHSNIVPWELISKLKGFTIKYAQVHSDGTLDYEDFESKFSSKTKLACLSQVSNVTGIINDVKRVAKVAHDHRALMLVDAAQSVPHLPVDVQDLDADFLAFSGHKMLGPTGIGVLYGKKHLLDEMAPFQGGGEMINDVSYSPQTRQCSISWNETPWKFEAGTPNIAGTVGLGAAIKYLQQWGMKEIFEHEKTLTKYAMERMLSCCSKLRLHGTTDTSLKCGIMPFSVEGLGSHDVALFLDTFGVMIRSGYHCAQPLHQIFQLKSSARASFYLYNTKEEIDRFVEVLQELEKLQ
ncbi:MAG: cysteine desulfurase [Candidatus Bathyarchaeota archaeon]|nr:cysteine desulfurase [Candidatus Bathyarchaeota archaeon]